jgi:hypothetical protein
MSLLRAIRKNLSRSRAKNIKNNPQGSFKLESLEP